MQVHFTAAPTAVNRPQRPSGSSVFHSFSVLKFVFR
jgi:hypothetical protein